MNAKLYHFTDIEGLFRILCTNTMELCAQSSHIDIRKVCFTTNDSLWVHGEWRIEFRDSIYGAGIKPWDYDEAFGQYAQEQEWFSTHRISDVRSHIREIANSAERLFIDVARPIDKNTEVLYKVSLLILYCRLSEEFFNMWLNVFKFYNKYHGKEINKKFTVYIDNDEFQIIK